MSKPDEAERVKAAAARKRKELTAADGPDVRQGVGDWFRPIAGVRYRIPDDAGNYVTKRGWSGVCLGATVSSFGHTWAHMMFDTPVRAQLPIPIRTCYLQPDDDHELEIVKPPDSANDVISMMEHAWAGPSNSGTEQIAGV